MPVGERETLKQAARLPSRLRRVETGDGSVTVYELPGAAAGPPRASVPGERLAAAGWHAVASAGAELAARAIDGDGRTRWDTRGPQRQGTWFELDLGRLERVGAVRLTLGPSRDDFPRGYRVEISGDGRSWTTVTEVARRVLPIAAFLQPGPPSVAAVFAARPCRFLRITTLGDDPTYYWAIHEVEVLRGD
jgi:hypothetical protein